MWSLLGAAASDVGSASLAAAVIDAGIVVDCAALRKSLTVRNGGVVAEEVLSTVSRFDEPKSSITKPGDNGASEFAGRCGSCRSI